MKRKLKTILKASIVIVILLSLTKFLDRAAFSIDLSLEGENIKAVAKNLIIENFRDDDFEYRAEILKDTIRVYNLQSVDGSVLMLYSYHYRFIQKQNEYKSNEFYMMHLRVVKRDSSEYGYKLMGGFGAGGDIPNGPFSQMGSGNAIFGTIQNEEIARFEFHYSDGVIIDYDTNGQDYYFFQRDDTEELIHVEITAYDKDDNLVE